MLNLHFQAALRPVRASAYRLYEQVFGSGLFSYLPSVLENANLDKNGLERVQVAKLRSLLEIARERSSFYRERMREVGILPAEIDKVSDIDRLPPVTKTELRVALAEGRLLTQPRSTLVKGQTGGSTGQPLVFYHYPPARAYARACDVRAFLQMGWRLGDPIITVWGRHTNVSRMLSMIQWVRNSILAQPFLEADRLSNANARLYLQTIDRMQPAILFGYVTSLVQLAQIGSNERLRLRPPGAVATTAEMLLSHERKLLSDYFGAEVFDVYGCSEVESLAFECPAHTGLHVAADHVLIEITEDGRVLVTDLDNYAMPFIRYEIGDMAEWGRKQCPCGSAFPLLSRVLGRRSDMIRGPNGNRVHGEFFTHLLEDLQWIERYDIVQFQVVQEELRFLRVRLVAGKKPNLSDEMNFTKIVRSFLGDTQVFFEYPDSLAPSESGKRRFTLSHLD